MSFYSPQTSPKTIIQEDGWLLFHGHGVTYSNGNWYETTGSCIYMTINNTTAAHHHLSHSVASNSQEETLLPVKKGDMVTVTNIAGTGFVYFLPMRK